MTISALLCSLSWWRMKGKNVWNVSYFVLIDMFGLLASLSDGLQDACNICIEAVFNSNHSTSEYILPLSISSDRLCRHLVWYEYNLTETTKIPLTAIIWITVRLDFGSYGASFLSAFHMEVYIETIWRFAKMYLQLSISHAQVSNAQVILCLWFPYGRNVYPLFITLKLYHVKSECL
jgi:hypothetical protein